MKHPDKGDTNADVAFTTERAMGVFDGVGGVISRGLRPEAMSSYLADSVATLLERRLEGRQSAKFDRDIQLEISGSVRPDSGGWLRNLVGYAFLKTTVLGSSTFGVCQMTDGKLNYAMLGDVQLLVFRRNMLGVRTVCASKIYRQGQTPAQTFLVNARDMNPSYVNSIFSVCDYGVVALEKHDTVVLCSDGVTDNLSEAMIAALVEKGYANNEITPEDLAKDIVAESLVMSYTRTGKKDDTTCAVAYIY